MKVVLQCKPTFRALCAKDMCEFLIKRLGLTKSRYFLGITTLPKGTGDAGLVMHDDKRIALFLNFRTSWNEFISTIGHEMVHVKQVARGQLRQIPGSKQLVWRGKLYRRLPAVLNRPWELEAFRAQDIHVQLYEQHLFTFARKQGKIGPRGSTSAVRKVRRRHPS